MIYSKKIACCLILLFTQTICLSAQSTKIKVSGRIIDSEKVPIAGASVLLLSNADSAYIAGTVSGTDGLFELSCFAPDEYILSFSMIGYKKAGIPKQTTQGTNVETGKNNEKKIVS